MDNLVCTNGLVDIIIVINFLEFLVNCLLPKLVFLTILFCLFEGSNPRVHEKRIQSGYNGIAILILIISEPLTHIKILIQMSFLLI